MSVAATSKAQVGPQLSGAGSASVAYVAADDVDDAAARKDVAKLAAFFEDTCGIGTASSLRYAQALVLQHDVASVKRLQYLQKNGKLAAVAALAGMAEDDLEALQGELDAA